MPIVTELGEISLFKKKLLTFMITLNLKHFIACCSKDILVNFVSSTVQVLFSCIIFVCFACFRRKGLEYFERRKP
jgi:hypothetical protein